MENYDWNQILGRGGFAEVYSARHRTTGKQVAIKLVDKEKLNEHGILDRIGNEVKIHRMLRHKNIVEYIDSFEDEHYFYIVMEQVNYGNLYKHLKKYGPLSEEAAAAIVSQVLEAVTYMHLRGVVHRDLKLSNILLQEGNSVRVCDFGLAVRLEHPDEEHFTLCGTPNYIAPEVVSKHAHSFPVDLWSIGCLFYFLVCGAPPAEQVDVKEIMAKFFAMNKANETSAEFSHGALNFLQCLLKSNPSKRASAAEILQHPFLQISRVLHDGKKVDHVSAQSSSSSSSLVDSRRKAHTQQQQLLKNHGTKADCASVDRAPLSASASQASTAVNSYALPHNSGAGSGEEASTQLRAPQASNEPRLQNVAQSPPGTRRTTAERAVGNAAIYGSPEPDAGRKSGESTLTGVSRRTKRSDGGTSGPVPGPMPHPTLTDAADESAVMATHACGSAPVSHLTAPVDATSVGAAVASVVERRYNDADAHDLAGMSWLRRMRTLRRSLNVDAQTSLSKMSTSLASLPEKASLRADEWRGVGSGGGPDRGCDDDNDDDYNKNDDDDDDPGDASVQAVPATWIDARLQPLVYCSHQGELLVVSGVGDVLLCSLARDHLGNERRYRVCIRARRPLAMLVGNMSDKMTIECRRLIAERFDGGTGKNSHGGGNDKSHGNTGNGTSSTTLGKDGTYTDLELLSNKLWVKEHDLRCLSSPLRRIQVRVLAMLDVVKRRQPHLVLYVKASGTTTSSSSAGRSGVEAGARRQGKGGSRDDGGVRSSSRSMDGDEREKKGTAGASAMAMKTGTKGGAGVGPVLCKCMLMNNLPLPDFCVQWADGTKLRYALESGQLQVTSAHGDFHWDAAAEGGGPAKWATSAPVPLRACLVRAQRYMARCLTEQARLDMQPKVDGGAGVDGPKRSVTSPHIVFCEDAV